MSFNHFYYVPWHDDRPNISTGVALARQLASETGLDLLVVVGDITQLPLILRQERCVTETSQSDNAESSGSDASGSETSGPVKSASESSGPGANGPATPDPAFADGGPRAHVAVLLHPTERLVARVPDEGERQYVVGIESAGFSLAPWARTHQAMNIDSGHTEKVAGPAESVNLVA